jgi:hypothetical protein
VQQDGHAFALAPGIVTLIGKSGLRDSAVATLTVVPAVRPTSSMRPPS